MKITYSSFVYRYCNVMCIPPIHMCISAELSAMRLNTLLGVITANALGLEEI